jgi:lipopolysaccharide exporter
MKKINRSTDVIKKVGTLIFGNSFAEIVALCSYPILSRLYTPGDFGQMTVLWAYCSIFCAIACWRLESVIVIEKDNCKAKKIADLCVLSTFILTGALFGFGFIGQYLIDKNLIIFNEIDVLQWALPASVMSSGLYLMLSHWSVRSQSYRHISISRIFGVIISTIVKIGYGFQFGSSYIILLSANIISSAFQVIVIFYFFIKKCPREICKPESGLSLLKQYKSFPAVQMPTTLLSSLTNNLPSVVLLNYFSPEIVGFFGFAYAILIRPVTVVSESIAKVLLKEISATDELLRPQRVRKFTFAIAILAFPFFAILWFYAEIIFSYIFGDKWSESGVFAQVLSVWLYLAVISIPSVQLMTVNQQLGLNFWYTVTQSFIRIIVILLMGSMGYSAFQVIAAYSAVNSVMQIIYIQISIGIMQEKT